MSDKGNTTEQEKIRKPKGTRKALEDRLQKLEEKLAATKSALAEKRAAQAKLEKKAARALRTRLLILGGLAYAEVLRTEKAKANGNEQILEKLEEAATAALIGAQAKEYNGKELTEKQKAKQEEDGFLFMDFIKKALAEEL